MMDDGGVRGDGERRDDGDGGEMVGICVGVWRCVNGECEDVGGGGDGVWGGVIEWGGVECDVGGDGVVGVRGGGVRRGGDVELMGICDGVCE